MFHFRFFPNAGLAAALLLGLACADAPSVPTDSARSDALRTALDTLIAAYPDVLVAVAVRDPATGVHVDLNADSVLHAASTMKIPVMIEVFRQAETGRFALDDSLEVRNRFRSIVDGSPYSIEDDADDAIYEHLGARMSIRDLVYQMITVSSNLATNLLIDSVSADAVQASIEQLGTDHMRVLRGVEDLKAYERGLSNTATAADLAALLAALQEGRAVSPEVDRQMVDILLDQRFNEMIPAGLPTGTRVAHKTGNITAIAHDAAIVYPEGGAPYVLVVLTRGFEDTDEAAALIAEIARTVHQALRGSSP